MAVESSDSIYRIADNRVAVALEPRVVTVDEQPLENITPIQFDLLAVLASKPDNVFPWAVLSREVLGYEYDNSVRVALRQHVTKVRAKLGRELGDTQEGAIRRKWGLGYYAVSTLAGTIEATPETQDDVRCLADGRVKIHLDKWAVTADDEIVPLTPLEYRIVNLLSRGPDQPIHIYDLAREVWGQYNQGTRVNVRQRLYTIRQKLGGELGDPVAGLIRTSREGLHYHVASTLKDD